MSMEQAYVTEFGEVARRAAKRMRARSRALAGDDLIGNFDSYVASVDLSTLCTSLARAALCWSERPDVRSDSAWEEVFSEGFLSRMSALLGEGVDVIQAARDDEGGLRRAQPLLEALRADPKILAAWPRYTYGGDRI